MDSVENKKVNFEDLSQEELIKKCRSLIALAQKAKSSRESLQVENNRLKEQLNQKTEHQSDPTYEILAKFTEEKLALVTQIENIKSKNSILEDRIKFYEEENQSMQYNIGKLETENISYKRQVKRLTNENEQLLTDLSTLEAQITELNNLGIQQQEQLLQLEKTNGNSLRDLQCNLSDSVEEVKKLNNIIKSKENEIKELFQELQALKIIKKSTLYDSNKNCDIYVKEINDLRTTNEMYHREVLEIKNLNEKLKDKVKLYHSKLKKFAQTIKEIKEEKKEVLQIFKAYTEQIKEWKNQLFSASQQLVKLVNNFENENKILKESKEKEAPIINFNNEDLMEKLAIYEHDINVLKQQLESEKKDFDHLVNNIRRDITDKYDIETKSTTKELSNVLKQQLENEKKDFDHLVNNIRRDITDKYDIETKSTTKELSSCKEEINRFEKELIVREKYLNEAVSAKEKLELENKKLLEAIDNITLELASKEIILKETFESNEKYNIKNQKLNEMLTNYEETISDLNKELASKEIILRQENSHLNDVLKQSMDTEKLLAEKSSEEIIRLAESKKELEENILKLQLELDEIRNKDSANNFAQTDEDFAISNDSSGENGIDLKRENSELLLEMNQMNQALKERGEFISKLEAHCEEIKKRLQLYETQANKNVDSITEMEETIKALTKEVESLRTENLSVNGQHISSKDIELIAGLQAEIGVLKEKCNSLDNSYAESETMSTSTISKCEEVNRLKELEGPWEERYGKLRTLAIKLKAKIREQAGTITEQQIEKEKVQEKLLNTVKTFQSQIDSLQDNLDKTNAENKQYLSKLNSVAENISKDKQLLVANEETIVKFKKEIEKLNAEKHGVDTWKKQVGAKVQTLRKELEAKNLLIKEYEVKVSKLEADLDMKDSLLKNEQESHKHTKSLLDQTSNESKKNSVLNLEMQDYERSVKELSQKVEKQRTENSNLLTQFDMQKCTVNALREQNKILEERIHKEEKNGNTTLMEITTFKKKISNLEEVLKQKEDKIMDMTRLLATTRSENEELSTELSKVITEHQKSLEILKSERDQLRNQILSLQQSFRESQDNLKLKKDELIVIQEDYETYKVRAQSVLKKTKNRDLGLEEKLLEELATFKSQNSELTNAIKELRDNFDSHQFASEEIRRERDEFNKKCRELEIEVEELKSYSEQLANKYQKAINDHAETLRNLKVHGETLSQCYRQQLTEQEVRFNREIIELQSRLDQAPSPIETTPVHLSMPREEGEGSESIESNSPPNNVHPIPLERLLDSKSDDEVMHVKKQLFEQESKVVHLTALLSDTEQDLAKHVQMNKLLKEEIRRQQRSVEREKHAGNLEYLKNVVFKFVTLTSGDERTRLVPVLNTILKLSPEETQKLVMVARGDPGIKGWTNYLPMWSSPNKPQ